ncbi:MAG TPA: hypothetical protein VFO06_09275 [Gemmatimonadales bacterium]|nr:hypothetical protein [Gemmatimonadales bacterium]
MATFVGQVWIERIRHRADIAVEFIQWCDVVWLAVGRMESSKAHTFEGVPPEKRAIGLKVYEENRDTALTELLRNAPTAKVAIGWGAGKEYDMARRVGTLALEATRTMTRARKDTWDADREKAMALIDEADKVRLALYERLVTAGSLPIVLGRYRELLLPRIPTLP